MKASVKLVLCLLALSFISCRSNAQGFTITASADVVSISQEILFNGPARRVTITTSHSFTFTGGGTLNLIAYTYSHSTRNISAVSRGSFWAVSTSGQCAGPDVAVQSDAIYGPGVYFITGQSYVRSIFNGITSINSCSGSFIIPD